MMYHLQYFDCLLYTIRDKAVYPFLIKYFEIPLLHPKDETSLDEVMEAKWTNLPGR
jgi:hypothetical protein